MLRHELEYLFPLVPEGARILDLGSGFGELSKPLVPPTGHLVAVDAEPRMASGFAGDPRFEFVVSNVATYEPIEQFDIVLLFGVVTYLTIFEEESVYDLIRAAVTPHGLACIKHQCSDATPFEVETACGPYGERYAGRYPSIDEERERLERRFNSVEVGLYPTEMKRHPNSTHVKFLCREPRPLK